MSDSELLHVISDLAEELRATRRARDELQRELNRLHATNRRDPDPVPPQRSTPIVTGSTKLTARQARVLLMIANYIDARGMPPTMRNIGTAMGIRSTNGVNDHLRALVRKGVMFKLEPDEGLTTITRGIGLTEEDRRVVDAMKKPGGSP